MSFFFLLQPTRRSARLSAVCHRVCLIYYLLYIVTIFSAQIWLFNFFKLCLLFVFVHLLLLVICRNRLLPSQPPSPRKLPPRYDLIIKNNLQWSAVENLKKLATSNTHIRSYYLATQCIIQYTILPSCYTSFHCRLRMIDTNQLFVLIIIWYDSYSRKQPKERRERILLKMETPRQSR